MPKRAYRKADKVQTVYQLVRSGETIGQFSSQLNAMQDAERLIKVTVGLPPSSRLRVEWANTDGCKVLNYGRDAHDFRFTVRPWPLDGAL